MGRIIGIRYKSKPSEFEEILKKENGLAGTLGKSEYEDLARKIIEKSLDQKSWVEMSLEPVEDAEMMADSGYLFRISSPVKRPRYDEVGWLCSGIYQITNEALEQIKEKNS